MKSLSFTEPATLDSTAFSLRSNNGNFPPNGTLSISGATTERFNYPYKSGSVELFKSDHALLSLLDSIEKVLKENPENWNRKLFPILKNFLRQTEGLPVSEFAKDIIPKILNLVKTSFKNGKDSTVEDHKVAAETIATVHQISDSLSALLNDKKPIIGGRSIDIHELGRIPNVEVKDQTISITHPINGEVYVLPLPQRPDLLCKGGYPRLLLKLYSGAPLETILAELPLNDIDFMTVGESEGAAQEISELQGNPLFAKLIDPAGTEKIAALNTSDIFASRDMTLNSCFLSHSGLHFSFAAFRDCRLGKLTALGAGKDLYGSDCFYHHDLKLLKNSGMMRFIKTLAEGKGLFFEIPLRNTSVKMGIYWLVLARRFMGKHNADELLQNAYEIGKQCGQVRENENNIFDVLERVHQQYPFFSMTSGKMNSLQASKWLVQKLLKQARRTFRRLYRYKQSSTVFIMPEDDIPVKVSMPKNRQHYMPAEEFALKWDKFLVSCEKRHKCHTKNDQ